MNALWGSIPAQPPGAPHPRFPVKFRGFPGLHAPFLKERRTRGPVQSCGQEIRGISLVFREMWDTTGLPLKPPRSPQLRTGAPCSHQRTWAENDGRSPSTAFRVGPYPLFFRSEAKRNAVERSAVQRSFPGNVFRTGALIKPRPPHHPSAPEAAV